MTDTVILIPSFLKPTKHGKCRRRVRCTALIVNADADFPAQTFKQLAASAGTNALWHLSATNLLLLSVVVVVVVVVVVDVAAVVVVIVDVVTVVVAVAVAVVPVDVDVDVAVVVVPAGALGALSTATQAVAPFAGSGMYIVTVRNTDFDAVKGQFSASGISQ